MSTICLFRRLPSGNFEHYITPTNSWNFFEKHMPDTPDGSEVVVPFEGYVVALRMDRDFVSGMPNSIGIRNYPIAVCRETGRVEVAEGDAIIAEPGVYYAIECRQIFKPVLAILRRAIKSHGRDYCYLSLRGESDVGGGE